LKRALIRHCWSPCETAAAPLPPLSVLLCRLGEGWVGEVAAVRQLLDRLTAHRQRTSRQLGISTFLSAPPAAAAAAAAAAAGHGGSMQPPVVEVMEVSDEEAAEGLGSDGGEGGSEGGDSEG
jgi:hypothetical protein